MATKIKAVVFDLDNTLIDFWNFKHKCIDAAIDAMIKAGLKMEKDKAKKLIVDLYEELGMEYSFIFQKFLKKVLGKIDYRILSHALIAYRKTREGLLIPYPGVKETLLELKKRGYKLAIISDAPKHKAWLRLVLMGADELFDVVITFEDTKQRKPHKLPFSAVLKKLKMKADEILLVGDSIHRDMEGGKAVGMNTVLATYGRTLKPEQKPESADFIIEKVKDLLEIAK